MRNILIISGHTDLEDSVANKTILEIIGNKMPEAEIDYLDKLYPDYRINVEAEQESLLKLILSCFSSLFSGIPCHPC